MGQSGGEAKSDEGGRMMSFVMWVLVAVLAGLLAGDIALGLAGSVVVSWLFQTQWAPDPSLVAVIFVAAVGAAGLIVAQRTIFPSHA